MNHSTQTQVQETPPLFIEINLTSDSNAGNARLVEKVTSITLRVSRWFPEGSQGYGGLSWFCDQSLLLPSTCRISSASMNCVATTTAPLNPSVSPGISEKSEPRPPPPRSPDFSLLLPQFFLICGGQWLRWTGRNSTTPPPSLHCLSSSSRMLFLEVPLRDLQPSLLNDVRFWKQVSQPQASSEQGTSASIICVKKREKIELKNHKYLKMPFSK